LFLVRAECDVAFICRTYIKHGIDPANATRKGKLDIFHDITRDSKNFQSRGKTLDTKLKTFPKCPKVIHQIVKDPISEWPVQTQFLADRNSNSELTLILDRN